MGINGTLFGSYSWVERPSPQRYAVRFTTGGGVDLGNNSVLTSKKGFTLFVAFRTEDWVTTTEGFHFRQVGSLVVSGGEQQAVFDFNIVRDVSGLCLDSMMMGLDKTGKVVSINSMSNPFSDYPSSFDPKSWHTAAVSYSHTGMVGGIRLYFDGVLYEMQHDYSEPLGARIKTDPTYTDTLKCNSYSSRIQNIALYNAPLKSTAIQSLHAAQVLTPDS